MSERASVQQALSVLSKALRQKPFSILREAGLQAELRALLLRDKSLRGKVPIQIGEHKPLKPSRGERRDRYNWSPELLGDQLVRVQIEMKILGQRDAPSDKDDKTDSRVDVVVVKHATNHPALPLGRARLICYPNGPGDVVATMNPQDIAAAIEIKASPSVDPKQRALYRKDVARLLDLVEQKDCVDLAAFFFIVDKSQSLFGDWVRPHKGKVPIDWQDPNFVNGPQGLNLASERIDLTKERPESGPFVEIWSVSGHRENPVLFASRAKSKKL